MSIATNSIVTYSDITSIVLNSLKSVCCNIDNYASNVPTRLRTGQGQVAVKSITSSVSGGATSITHRWYVNPSNLITIVSSTVVDSEWSTFLSNAGINSRSNKVLRAVDLGEIVGLFMRFMSYHVKPIYSRRQIYNTIETNPGIYEGCKYVSGTLSPEYITYGTDPSNIPVTNNNNITDMINLSFQANRLMTHYDNPINHKCTLI